MSQWPWPQGPKLLEKGIRFLSDPGPTASASLMGRYGYRPGGSPVVPQGGGMSGWVKPWVQGCVLLVPGGRPRP